jgi:hypothetical protein
MPLDIILAPGGLTPILTDTLFVSWEEDAPKDQLPGIEYTIVIHDKDGADVDERKIEHNWIVLPVKSYLEKADWVVLEIRSKRTRSETSLGVKMDNKENAKLRTDIERLGNNYDLAMLTAILDLNKYHHDRNFLLYRMMTRRHKTSGVLATYVGRLTVQFDLK